jgi:hypothetical protein
MELPNKGVVIVMPSRLEHEKDILQTTTRLELKKKLCGWDKQTGWQQQGIFYWSKTL